MLEVSVVMGVYNEAHSLALSIESILSQEGVQLEFIIVNDGSTDATLSVLESYAKNDSRVKIINIENRGLTKALMEGCNQASAPYIARQDAGDKSMPGRLYQQYQKMKSNPDLAFVSSGTRYVGPEGEFLYERRGKEACIHEASDVRGTANRPILKDAPTCHPSVMFKKSAYIEVNGYRPEFYYCQDHDLWHRLSMIGLYQCLSEALYEVQLRTDSISSNHRSIQRAYGRIAREAYQARLTNGDDDDVLEQLPLVHERSQTLTSKRFLDSKWNYLIAEQLRRNGDRRSRLYFKKSITQYPFNFKAWIKLGADLLRI